MRVIHSKVTPPVGHPLRAGYNPETARRATDGDKHPSDLDDVFPTVQCKIATGAELAPQLEPDIVAFEPLAEQNFRDNLGKAEAGGLTSGSDGDKEDRVCGSKAQGGGCQYEVKVTYVTPQAIAPYRADVNGFAGPCVCDSRSGRSCFGPTHVMCHSFGSWFAASAFQSAKKAEAEALFQSGGYQCGKTDVLNVGGIKGIPGDGYGGECEDGGSPGGGAGPPGAPSGPTTNPGCDSPETNCNCGPGSKRNAAGNCEPIKGEYEEGSACPPGHKRDERTRLCIPDDSNCPTGTHLNLYGVCVAK
jgi:hypothetical protein